MFIHRPDRIKAIETALGRSPVTALLGPRQCGKTTLARVFGEKYTSEFFDLESPLDLQRLTNPEMILSSTQGLVIIDEIQTRPDLFNVLRVLSDRPGNTTKFLILGSASPDSVKNVSETLAGRCEFIELSGFNFSETGVDSVQSLWLRGGFPRSFLAGSLDDSIAWREGFIRTFLERDIPQLGITVPAMAMRRFWTMIAHYHGQTLNSAEIGRSLGLSDKTIRSYLDILTGTYMLRQLLPWFENISKRQVKAPKIYIRDSGLFHSLLTTETMESLMVNPRLGASWEGFALEQVIHILGLTDIYFWSTYSGAELDLLFFKNGKRYGIEFKYNESPKLTKSMRVAFGDLRLSHLWIIYPGRHVIPVEENMSMLPLSKIGMLSVL
ncbi:MAG: ATP-binding protein [Proteobacteria bacterium]|nr:ATP-binding protein [Pseudomonadota bacterium]